jgi:Fe-S cluster assembly ATP-binding protein
VVRPNRICEPDLRGVDLTIGMGEVHALMGPNGSGKTRLAHTVAGLPNHKVAGG